MILPILILGTIEFLIYKYFSWYSFVINKYIITNTPFISAINTYSVAVFTITIAFIPLIYMVNNKIYFEEFMEQNHKEFKNALLMSTLYSLLTFFVSLFNLIYQSNMMIGLMIIMFILETIPFILLTIVTYRFMKYYLDMD